MSADLHIRDLSVRLGGRLVLSEVSLDLSLGRFVAVVGPNGAGKTSLLRAIVGLVPHGGRVALGADDLAGLSARERARRIAYLPQGHEVHWPLPARDIVALGRFPHGAADPDRLGPSDLEMIAEAMRVTETVAFADRPVTSLSGGERARVALARVFAAGAPVILADEPTAALDPRHQIDVMSALRARARSGALVVAVTHDLGLAARYADTVVLLQGGRLAGSGPPAEALAPDLLRRVFGIEAFLGEYQGAPVLVPWS
ncbi:ABC transporter ATP-binding protein [Enterovirga sp. CN4-39]|uniref:ABC transporter ATP-binding protein n=1 Tax=Enterovirga sp. CN4-39 TaxID=3400910 RepID=UPI003C077184